MREIGKIMAKVIFGNHASVLVPQKDRDSIRKFYCDVLGGTITRAQDERDFIRLPGNTYFVFLYGDLPDVSEFGRTARSFWLELKSEDVEGMREKDSEFGVGQKARCPGSSSLFSGARSPMLPPCRDRRRPVLLRGRR
jgi:hypothetical protein